MRAFASLLDRLLLTPSRNGKLRLLLDHFLEAPDPERGLAVAAIAGTLDFPTAKPAMIRGLIAQRMDPELFALSYDYVGDLAETVALAWPVKRGSNHAPSLAEVVESLSQATSGEASRLLAGWLDAIDATERWALLKLITGALRIGAGPRLVKQALADFGDKPVSDIEEVWPGLAAPYVELFAWLEARGPKPAALNAAPFRPVMLAHALDDERLEDLDPTDFAAEWKWDGIRVQLVSEPQARRLYSRAGEDISHTFPEILADLDFIGTVDGELLIRGPDGEAAPFSSVQQRLNRKRVSAQMLRDYPAFVRAYDLLSLEGAGDLRRLTFRERRERLETLLAAAPSPRIDLSPLIPFSDWSSLAAARREPPHSAIEGVMLKRWNSAYEAGRPKGPWFKWKRDPFTVDAVLMYAQRGRGRRGSFYSDFTFGLWRDGALLPIGKAYFGFTDAELRLLDRFVREHTTERFGPVRAVRAEASFGLVLEIAFEGVQRSARHKSGFALRFPRISRIRWDKPADQADDLGSLERLL